MYYFFINFNMLFQEQCDQGPAGGPTCTSDCTSITVTGPLPIGAPTSVSPIDSKAPLNAPSDSIGNAPQDNGPAAGVSASVLVPAIVVPVVVVAAGLIILLVLLRRRKKRKGSLLHGKSRVEIAMGTYTSAYKSTRSNLQISESIDDRLKIPYKSLVFKKEIGAGSYGKVYVG